jgi:hypothetical protein
MVKIRSVIALILGCTFLIAPAIARAADLLLIHEAINSLTAVQWPDFISRAQGFNEQQGLNVDIVLTQPESMIGALLGGSTEIALPNATGLALSVDKGANIVAVGIGADNIPYHFIAPTAVFSVKASTRSFACCATKNASRAQHPTPENSWTGNGAQDNP